MPYMYVGRKKREKGENMLVEGLRESKESNSILTSITFLWKSLFQKQRKAHILKAVGINLPFSLT